MNLSDVINTTFTGTLGTFAINAKGDPLVKMFRVSNVQNGTFNDVFLADGSGNVWPISQVVYGEDNYKIWMDSFEFHKSN